MSEFTTLSIHKKLEKGKKDELYWSLHAAQKKDLSLDAILQKAEINPKDFGKVRFIENRHGIFVEHISNVEEVMDTQQMRCQMEIPSEWLLCFSYQEMSVIGLDMGVFQAEAQVGEVIERLCWLDINHSSYDLFLKRDALLKWIRKNANPEDRIHLCTNWIFYHPDGKYDFDFVRQHINNKILELRKMVHCNHWSKNAVVRPEQVQMTA
ncbi:hypothetical protein ACFVS2_25375 [Brevibacillus sp. NPDC058079]|uniref:hypothetical protein n=1 Tax=Brevibacillus sp. NPDC058079 TaxID=3346330 RepID=UPI0036E6975C